MDPANHFIVPVTVNLHITPICNYRCGFCYAPFPGIRAARDPEEWVAVIRRFARYPFLFGHYKIDKLTFAGGEPTLVPYLPALLRETRKAGLVSSIVTNGKGLTDEFLERCAADIDVVGLSVDSPHDSTNALLGRGEGDHLDVTWAARDRLRRYPHIRVKLNTVVTKHNWRDDFHDFVHRFGPDRWKVFQVTRIEDQNGSSFQNYEVSPEQFASFRMRHLDLRPVVETDADIKGSYLMVDPERRFFGNSEGRHVYSEPILQVGVEEAVRQIGWSPDAYMARDGTWDWRGDGQVQP